jgi:hypothetical protein
VCDLVLAITIAKRSRQDVMLDFARQHVRINDLEKEKKDMDKAKTLLLKIQKSDSLTDEKVN